MILRVRVGVTVVLAPSQSHFDRFAIDLVTWARNSVDRSPVLVMCGRRLGRIGAQCVLHNMIT